jgi:hypothetical protein
VKTKPRGRPITGNPKAEHRRKYYADRYQRLKAEGLWNVHNSTRPVRKRQRQDPHKVEVRLLQLAEQMSHKSYHATSVNWEHISAGRSNS